jgi:hypothetical protein
MISKLKYILDPLDREVLDRAFDEAWAAVHAKANTLIESGSDEELEALLRRELMEIASFNGLDEQSAQKIFPTVGSNSQPGIGKR